MRVSPAAHRPTSALPRHVDSVAPTGAVPPYDAVIFDLDEVAAGQAGPPVAGKVRPVAGAIDLVHRLVAGGVPVAVATTRRDAHAVLAVAGVADLFDVVIDAADAPEGPALFRLAAGRLGVEPSRAAVVTGDVAGVAAAADGGFGLVVGVDRGGRRAALEDAGAGVVVADVALVDLGALRTDPSVLVYEGFDPAHEGHREALTTLGNGYLGTRGAAPEHAADGVHYPGTYLAGVYNRLTSVVAGREVEDEHLVNAPNWLLFDLRIGDGSWWSAGGVRVGAERRELDLCRGVLTRTAELTDPAGRRLHLTQRRLVSMHRPHLAALETTLVADGWSGTVTVRSGVDAGVRNTNVAEYAALANRHLTAVSGREAQPGVLMVEAETPRAVSASPSRPGPRSAGRPPGDRLGSTWEAIGTPTTWRSTCAPVRRS